MIAPGSPNSPWAWAMSITAILRLANGAMRNQFDRELRRVLENIQDPNTKAEAKRSITVKIEFRDQSPVLVGRRQRRT